MTDKTYFKKASGSTSPILRAKASETEKDALERMTGLGWDMNAPYHFVENNKSFHAGPQEGCPFCSKMDTPAEKDQKKDTDKANPPPSGEPIEGSPAIEVEKPEDTSQS